MYVGCFMLRSISLLLLLSLKQTSNSLFVNEEESGQAGSGSGGEDSTGSSSISEKTSLSSDKYFLFHKNPLFKDHRVLTGIHQTRTVTSLMGCLLQCTTGMKCTSINYKDNMKLNCDLLVTNKDEMDRWEITKDVAYSHYAIVYEFEETMNFCASSPCAGNSTCDPESETCSCVPGYSGKMCDQGPPETCYDVGMDEANTGSGNYWIQPHPGFPPIYVYCDLETEGGMWTLVYSYTFTNYPYFFTLANAVTPRPSWPASKADVPISTSSPLNNQTGAVQYSLWEHIGHNILIKSNINDWIVCIPETGSLVTQMNGTILCRNVKNVTSVCSGFEPGRINWVPCGPKISGRNTMYNFDGCTGEGYPTHNPCELIWRDSHKKGVANPSGSIFLRS